MASLCNAIPQRTYRERAQPKSREKLGLLEKHKDYSARAQDYNAKKARLKILKEKATNRNPDEFHFGMMSSRTVKGVKVADRGNKALSQETVKLMKTQDAGYLRTVRERVRRQRVRLEEVLVVGDGGEGKEVQALGRRGETEGQKHTVFVDEEAEQQNFDPEEWFDTDANGLGDTYNRPRRKEPGDMTIEELLDEDDVAQSRGRSRKQQEAESQAKKQQKKDTIKVKHLQHFRKAKLEALRTQERELLVAEQELDRQRSQMNNTVGGVNKNGVKFKVRERKR